MTTLLAQMYNDSYYTPSTDYEATAALAGATTIIVACLWIALVAYILQAIFMGLVFKKAGQPMWKAWVPVYNSWTLLQLGGQNGIWAVLAFIPIVNIVSAVFMYISMYYIGKNLGKSDAFVLFAIFLPLVWLIWLAVDSSTWKGAKSQKTAANS